MLSAYNSGLCQHNNCKRVSRTSATFEICDHQMLLQGTGSLGPRYHTVRQATLLHRVTWPKIPHIPIGNLVAPGHLAQDTTQSDRRQPCCTGSLGPRHHTVRQAATLLHQLKAECLEHPPNCPNLPPNGFHLIGPLKKHLGVPTPKSFGSAGNYLTVVPFKKPRLLRSRCTTFLITQGDKWLNLQGDYLKKVGHCSVVS